MMCADFITSVDPNMLCEPSKPIFEALIDCACNRSSVDPMPGCKDVCEDNWCAGADPTSDCGLCIQIGYCNQELEACAFDS
jgi:hypothetical protein